MGVEFRQLQIFVAVAEELHFRRAARRVGLTQPALSHQIAQLEERLAVRLLERTSRSVSLTEAGSAFLTSARKLLADLDRAVDEARRIGGDARRRLVVGYVEYMNLPFLGPAMRALRERHPDAEVEHREMYSAEVVEALTERTIDLGFAFMPIEHPDLVARPVVEGEWVVVIPEEHALAAHEQVPLEALAGEPLVIFARRLNPPLHDWLIERLRAAIGDEPRVAYKTAQAQLGPNLVAEGVGLFVVASYVPRSLPPGVTMRPLSGFAPMRVAAAWRADNPSEVLRDFRDALPRRASSPRPRTER